MYRDTMVQSSLCRLARLLIVLVLLQCSNAGSSKKGKQKVGRVTVLKYDTYYKVLNKHPPMFKLVLLYDDSEDSRKLVKFMDEAARDTAKTKVKKVRETGFYSYNVTQGDRGFSVPAYPMVAFYRGGYKNAKQYTGGFEDTEDVIDYLREEILNVYMKDDEKDFPRSGLSAKVSIDGKEQEL